MNTTALLTEQKVKLLDGEFTPSEARDIVNGLIDVKINFHKLHRLSLWEGNCDSNTTFDNSRVAQLLTDKDNFLAFLKEMRGQGKKVKMEGVLNISVVD